MLRQVLSVEGLQMNCHQPAKLQKFMKPAQPVTTTVRALSLACSLFAVFIFARANVWGAEKSAKLPLVRIGYVSRSILDMPYMIARDRGLFREEGLEPELVFIRAGLTP